MPVLDAQNLRRLIKRSAKIGETADLLVGGAPQLLALGFVMLDDIEKGLLLSVDESELVIQLLDNRNHPLVDVL